MAGKPSRKGHATVVPRAGNMNGIKTGARLPLTRLIMGDLPPKMRRAQAGARAYRRSLEALVLAARGEVNASDAHLVDAATGAEVHASICRWLLRTRLETMSVADIARCSEQIVKAREARNRAVAALKLDDKPLAPWLVTLETDEHDETDRPAGRCGMGAVASPAGGQQSTGRPDAHPANVAATAPGSDAPGPGGQRNQEGSP